MAQSDTTIDHDEIRQWAEERGGTPAAVKGTGKKKDAGILRLDFEPKDDALEEISWDMFFEKFDKENLAFLYQDQTAKGEVSRFHKFVEREAETAKPSAKTSSGGKASGGAKSVTASKQSTGAGKTSSRKATGGGGASKAPSGSRPAQSQPKKRATSKTG